MENNDKNTEMPQSLKTAVMQSVVFNELRIGNYIQFSSGSIYAVDIIYKDYTMLKNWFAIPLSEEWLKMLGGEKDQQINLIRLNAMDGTITFYPEKNIFKILGAINGYNFGTYEIKYVHQLQNLYFSLTGRELTVA